MLAIYGIIELDEEEEDDSNDDYTYFRLICVIRNHVENKTY